MSQKNLPPGHRWVPTEDGSSTLFSEQFQEACHSTFGAREETLLHYVHGCRIPDKINLSPSLTLLEVGFGLGIGFLTSFEFLKNSPSPWHFLSLEIDPDLMEWFRQENSTHEFLQHLKWKDLGAYKILEAKTTQATLTVLVGNARETLPHYTHANQIKWSAIYQDAFSPKKNPILWTKEWFEFLKNNSSDDVILSTYSSSSSIRKSLIEAGWKLHKGEKFGPKRTSTRATLSGESDEEIMAHLARSPIGAITDDNIEEFLKGSK
jgi:chorismate dehydratase